MKAEHVQVELDRIEASKTNPRKSFAEEGLRELAVSIREVGILQPLLVRRMGGRAGGTPAGATGTVALPGTKREQTGERYELVAGERRLRAVRLLAKGFKQQRNGAEEVVQLEVGTVPCVVRELTDDQVLEIQLIENLQREDVSALEEAEGFRRLIDAKKYTVESLAEKLGKSRSHVFGRLRLCKASKEVQKALVDGSLDISKAGLIASIPDPKEQKRMLDHAYHYSFRNLKEEVERSYRKNLSAAPWQWEDTALVEKAGPCSTCPKRTGNMPDHDGSANVCTDVRCYEAKLEAHGFRRLAEAKTAGQPVLAPEDYDDYKDRAKYVELDGCASDLGEWEKTYRELLKGKAFVPTLVQTRNEGLKELLPRDQLWELFPRKQEPKRAVNSFEKKARERQKNERNMRTALGRALDEVGPVLAKKAETAKEDVKLWRMVAVCAATHFEDKGQNGKPGFAAEWLHKNWGVGLSTYGGLAKGALLKHVENLKGADELRATAVVILGINQFMYFYESLAQPNFRAACEWAGFDLEGRLKELLAEKKGKAAPEAKLKITRSKDQKKFGLNSDGVCTKPNRFQVLWPKKTKCVATILTARGKDGKWTVTNDSGVAGQGDNDWHHRALPGRRKADVIFKTEEEAVIAEFTAVQKDFEKQGKQSAHKESEYGGKVLAELCKRLPKLLESNERLGK